MAALLIVGEAWRSSRSQSKRRDSVDGQLEDLSAKLQELTARVDGFKDKYEERWEEEKQRFVFFSPPKLLIDTHTPMKQER